jgi:hypothetical protein
MSMLPQPPAPPQPTSHPPTSRQLPLPLAVSGVMLQHVVLAAPPTTATDVATHQVWSGLSPAMQTDLRRTAVRVLREVVGDAGHR